MKSYLKKLICYVMAFITSFSIIGCSLKPDEEEIRKGVEENLTQLFLAVQEGDKEKFITFFADCAIEQSDFEAGCDYVFDTFQGDLISFNFDFKVVRVSGDHIGPDSRYDYKRMAYDIITSTNEYTTFVTFYTKYQVKTSDGSWENKYPDGSYKIKQFLFAKKEPEWNDIDGWRNFSSSRDGIYFPGWMDQKIE